MQHCCIGFLLFSYWGLILGVLTNESVSGGAWKDWLYMALLIGLLIRSILQQTSWQSQENLLRYRHSYS